MNTRTIPFHHGLFFHAMISLNGREPDMKHRKGFNGYYMFRYEPRDAEEADKLMNKNSKGSPWFGRVALVLNSHESKTICFLLDSKNILQVSLLE